MPQRTLRDACVVALFDCVVLLRTGRIARWERAGNQCSLLVLIAMPGAGIVMAKSQANCVIVVAAGFFSMPVPTKTPAYAGLDRVADTPTYPLVLPAREPAGLP